MTQKSYKKLPVCASGSVFAGLVACQHTIYLSINNFLELFVVLK